ADKAQTALQKDPTHPEQVAAQFNMQVVHADNVEAGKPVPGVGTSQDFDQSLTGLKKGEVSQAVALPDNKVVLALVSDVIPARPSTFDEVKDQIRDTVVRARSQAALQKHARELYDKAKSMGGDLEKAAKSMGLTAKSSDAVDRSGSIDGLGSVAYIADTAFGRPDGTIFGPQNTPDGMMVGKVVQTVPADPAQFAAQRPALVDQVKSDKARDRASLFEAGLRDSLMKQKKLRIYQNVINQLVQQYRTS
ncbi:MAG TPA: peptidyl-prolyl cis-trans isomerase, partial [Bryobacteraceae bacterium]|nr:peptidyl-prolyl cis-trans isomerase [Bryobacteraceae bacterium]